MKPMDPIALPTPQESPFAVGLRYRVRCDFPALRDNFRTGEILVFCRDAYSRYDGYIGYFFIEPESEKVRIWDLADHEDSEIWQNFFEEVGDRSTGAI